MSQYVIDIKNDQQASALIQYLKSLDFIEVSPVKPNQKIQAATSAKDFLNGLQPDRQSSRREQSGEVHSLKAWLSISLFGW